MRVLVVGGSGLLGSYVARAFSEAGHPVTSSGHSRAAAPGPGVRGARLDITAGREVARVLDAARPELVVHAAGLTNVDACEQDPASSRRLNVEACASLAQAAGRAGARFVFYSTDYVFEGRRGAYAEDDATGPLNEYGRHKLEAERLVLAQGPDALVLRVSVVYGSHPVRVDFVRWLRDGWARGEVRRVFTDQTNSPTYAGYAARATVELVDRGARGVFHVAGRGGVTRYDFARRAAHVFGAPDGLVAPIESRLVHQAAPRPKDSSLDCRKLDAFLGRPSPSHDHGLEALRDEAPAGGAAGEGAAREPAG